MSIKLSNRDSAIELLRIIAMLLIVFHHFSVHGGFHYDPNVLTIPRFWVNLISMGGKIGVDLFVLISGYYLIMDKGPVFNLKRIVKLWIQIFFYSVMLIAVFNFADIATPSNKQMICAFFPIARSAWWFASTYFVLYILHPFINVMLRNFDKRMYQVFLSILMMIWCIIPTFLPLNYQSNSLTWFIFLYSLAGYVRLYDFNSKFTAKHYFITWLCTSALAYGGSCFAMILGTKWPIFAKYAGHIYAQNSLFVVVISVSLFMGFIKIKMNYYKWINVVASAAFGVYLIHDSNLGRPFLWKAVFHNASYQDNIMVIPYSIVVVLFVYAICTVVDLIRQYTIEKVFINVFGDSLDRATIFLNRNFDNLDKLLVFRNANKS